jgi:hypothetical protein
MKELKEEMIDIVYGVLLKGKFNDAGEKKARSDAFDIVEKLLPEIAYFIETGTVKPKVTN